MAKVKINFEGKEIECEDNLTLAACLYKNGVRIFSRSMKFHRPRGYYCGTGKCSSCMMEVDGIPNVRTCQVKVKDGMVVRRQHAWPNADNDILSILNKFEKSLGAGFYYHRFIHPTFLRNFYMRRIASFAGLGELPKKDPGVEFSHETINTDILIVGAGLAGLSAALEVSKYTNNAVLVEEHENLGGELYNNNIIINMDNEKMQGGEYIDKIVKEIKNIRILKNTEVFGIYPDRMAAQGNNTLYEIYAKKIILATGSYYKNLVFDNNDLPGIMLYSGVHSLIYENNVLPGKSAVIYGKNRYVFDIAASLSKKGLEIKGIITNRNGENFETYVGYEILKAYGKKNLEGIEISNGSERKTIGCDLLIMTDRMKTYELILQSGGEVKYYGDEDSYYPLRNSSLEIVPGIYYAGGFTYQQSLIEGRYSALNALKSLGFNVKSEDLGKTVLSNIPRDFIVEKVEKRELIM